MSSALAMASVTAVLKNLLDNALIRQSAAISTGDVSVTVLPPDRISLGAEERSQLNLYLYRLTPNSGRQRGGSFTSQDGPLATRETRQVNLALALDLHYLLTAYGEHDLQAEMLLGHAVQCLRQTPILTGDVIRSALAALSTGKAGGSEQTALAASSLDKQVEEIRISPEFLSMEDLTKLWSSLQARSRLSMTYLVSVVLIGDQPVSKVAGRSRSRAGVP